MNDHPPCPPVLTTLEHPFVNVLPNIDEFFSADNVAEGGPGHINTINAFCGRINDFADTHKGKIDESRFKGDMFEVFGEFLLKTMGPDNRIGIYDYQRNPDEDLGVDGFGVGANRHPATVQFKFRRGDYVLTANEDELSNFVVSSQNDFGVHFEDKQNMLIVTTGLEVLGTTMEKMLKGKVRVLNRENLRTLCDNNPEFWFRFWMSMKYSRKSPVERQVKTPRPHQKEALEAYIIDVNKRGKILLPTGVGKTLIAAMIIKYEIDLVLAKGETPYIKVNASRILLCFQLFKELSDYLIAHGINARMVNFNSGRKDETDYIAALREADMEYQQTTSTTNPQEVLKIYKQCCKTKTPLVVISTYHSSVKLNIELVPDLTTHDEAHNLVSEGFIEAATIPTKAAVFFTATEKITESDLDIGMNNVAIFDNVIYQRSALQMIDAGEMVKPFIHIEKAAEGQIIDVDKLDTDYHALFESVSSAFFAHETEVKKISSNPEAIGAKVLVVCRGQQDLIQMHKLGLFDEFRSKFPEVHVYGLSSEFGLYADGEMLPVPVDNAKKFKLIQTLQGLRMDDRAIIFHVDMIGEGIDVPGVTGVMPFRNCEESKFIQNVGRAARLCYEDKRRFYAGELPPVGLCLPIEGAEKLYIKPCCWVIIPTFLQNAVGFADRFQKIIDRMRTEYGWTPQQMVLNDNVRGLDDDEPMAMVNDKTKEKKHAKSGLASFKHTLEQMNLMEWFLWDQQVAELKITEGERLFKDGALEDFAVE